MEEIDSKIINYNKKTKDLNHMKHIINTIGNAFIKENIKGVTILYSTDTYKISIELTNADYNHFEQYDEFIKYKTY
jgi:hypothetical protein